MTYEITRTYAHKVHGEIGRAVLAVTDKGKLVLDGQELADASAEYLLTFALQSLQDAYAGSDNLAEAQGAFEAKRDKLLAGTIGVRTGGSGVSERTRIARSIVRAAFKAANAKGTDKRKEFEALSDSEQAETLDRWYTKAEAIFAPAVVEEIDRRKAEAARKAEMAKATPFDI